MKLARRFLIVLASVALVCLVMVGIAYAVENWRGQRAWETCQRDLQARGERLDAAAFIPPAVPDDQNLAMAPLFVRMYDYRVDPVTGLLTFPKRPAKNDLKDEVTSMPRGPWKEGQALPRSGGDWTTGHSLDLAAWQQYYRRRPDFPHADPPQSPAEDVLLALTKYAPVLDELAQAAATRPLTRFPVNWTEPLPMVLVLPHYNALQCLVGTLRLRILANLTLGRNDAAMRDLALAQRLIGTAAHDPFLIAQLVSVTGLGGMTQPIWEGLKARRWTGEELEQIKTGMRKLDYLKSYQQAIRGERAIFMCKTMDQFKAHGGVGQALRAMQGVQEVLGQENQDRSLQFYGQMIDLTPGGWYDQNKAIGCRFMQDDEIDTVDAKEHRVWLAKAKASASSAQGMTMNPYNWLVKIMVPVFGDVLRKMAAYQADVDHIVVACALEQYYLGHHDYPEHLEELVPTYLDHVPGDLIDGAPMRYRRTSDGRYLLYCIGWNGRDDGGEIAWQKDSARRDVSQGDWLWQYAELQPPASIQRSK